MSGLAHEPASRHTARDHAQSEQAVAIQDPKSAALARWRVSRERMGCDLGRGKVGSGSPELGATAGLSAKSVALAGPAGTGQLEGRGLKKTEIANQRMTKRAGKTKY